MLQHAYARDLRFPMIHALERRAGLVPQLPPGTALLYLLMREAWSARLMYDVRPYCSYRLLNHERKVKANGYRVTAVFEDQIGLS